MFADYELRAHRLAEQDQPIIAEILIDTYTTLLEDYYGDAVDQVIGARAGKVLSERRDTKGSDLQNEATDLNGGQRRRSAAAFVRRASRGWRSKA